MLIVALSVNLLEQFAGSPAIHRATVGDALRLGVSDAHAVAFWNLAGLPGPDLLCCVVGE
jgi:hypothetical protein